jgi:anti-sigma factor RsiW
MSDQDNISPFAPGNGRKEQLSEDKLKAYLEGRLPASEQHEVELWLSEDGMESDAIEGLRSIKPEETFHTVNKLKHELRKALVSKKHKRRPLRYDHFAWLAIAIIILLVTVAYIVICIAK